MIPGGSFDHNAPVLFPAADGLGRDSEKLGDLTNGISRSSHLAEELVTAPEAGILVVHDEKTRALPLSTFRPTVVGWPTFMGHGT